MPASVPRAAARLTERDLHELLREHAPSHGVPGAAIGVLRDGVETVASFGVANTQSGDPVVAESLFGLGSLTKSMVATAVVRLAEDGRLSLDDPVAARVPELRGAGWAERATVRDLLANRSGLPLRAALEFDFAPDTDEDGGLARLAARVAAETPTNVAWSYTNAGWCLLGRVLETVTRRRWEDAMTAVFAPAGMSHTTFATSSASELRVHGHGVTADGPAPVEPLASQALGPAGTTAASTVGDLLRFAALHLEDSALETMRRAQPAPRIHGWLDGWGLGWAWFDWDGERVWGWDSVLPGERAFLRLMPEHEAAIVLLANGEAGRALYRAVMPVLTRSLFGTASRPLRLDPRPGAAGDLARFSGVYAWCDRRVEVAAREASLLVTEEDDETEALPIDEQTFLVDAADPDNPTVTFGAFDAAACPQVLYRMIWGLPRLGA